MQNLQDCHLFHIVISKKCSEEVVWSHWVHNVLIPEGVCMLHSFDWSDTGIIEKRKQGASFCSCLFPAMVCTFVDIKSSTKKVERQRALAQQRNDWGIALFGHLGNILQANYFAIWFFSFGKTSAPHPVGELLGIHILD